VAPLSRDSIGSIGARDNTNLVLQIALYSFAQAIWALRFKQPFTRAASFGAPLFKFDL
jgi:hypothetical protein